MARCGKLRHTKLLVPTKIIDGIEMLNFITSFVPEVRFLDDSGQPKSTN